MKKASKWFSDLANKSKNIFNDKKSKDQNQAASNADDGGFDSGEDDDLIEIGKHKGAGAKSVFQNLESLTGDQIIQEDKYAHEFQISETKKANGPKSEFDTIKESLERSCVQESSLGLNSQTAYFSMTSFNEIEASIQNR